MATVATAWVDLKPSAKGFGPAVSKEIGGDLDAAGKTGGKRMGSGLGGALLPATKGLAIGMVAIFAAAKIGGFLKDANDEARESQKVGALTANVIKTTGGAAKVTAGQVGDLATAISNKTGVDDEAIQSGSNLLLTFKNVKNEVGAGANVFDRATAAAVDLSASGFGDVNGSAKMLGKALNDPIAGITALGRAGVTFTAGQKEQIKGMVEAGDVLGAQKIIMAEVESQVGGAAAASATAGEKLSTTWGNFKEQIGTALLPTIDAVMVKVTAFVGFLMTNMGPAFTAIGTFIAPVVAAVKGFFAAGAAGPSLLAPLIAFFQSQVVPAFASIVTAVQAFVAVALPIVQAFVAGMMARIQPMLPTIKTIFATIGQIIVAAMGLIKSVIERVTAVIKFVWENWGGSIMSFITGVWAKIFVVIQAALNIIQGVIRTVTAVIKGDWSGAWNGIKQILSGVWDAIKGIVSLALNIIGGVISAAWALIKAGVAAAWGGIKSAISTAWDGIKSAVSTGISAVVSLASALGGRILSAVGNLGGLLVSAGGDLLRGLANGITGAIGGVIRAATDAARAAVSAVKSALGIGSPSKVFAKLGEQTGEGFVNGLAGTDMNKAMASLVNVPRPGTLDFASSATRSAAVSGANTGATSGDIRALGDRIGAELDRQARTIQTMQRQMAGA